ncbi:hypothetical protein EDC96DRAFT_548601 [Choanephora cucurbitarum]|nr:hypothetical protein EDC96DRAFT_548601 [Choanephora cucurbitarum]
MLQIASPSGFLPLASGLSTTQDMVRSMSYTNDDMQASCSFLFRGDHSFNNIWTNGRSYCPAMTLSLEWLTNLYKTIAIGSSTRKVLVHSIRSRNRRAVFTGSTHRSYVQTKD